MVLELAWVVRKSGAPNRLVMERLRDLLSLRNVRAQNADLVAQALRWAYQGMDLADALHLVLSSRSERFVTFDRGAGQAGPKAPRAAARLGAVSGGIWDVAPGTKYLGRSTWDAVSPPTPSPHHLITPPDEILIDHPL